jgi:hypothetical protein
MRKYKIAERQKDKFRKFSMPNSKKQIKMIMGYEISREQSTTACFANEIKAVLFRKR